MLTKTHNTPVQSPESGVVHDTIAGPVHAPAPTASGTETRAERFRRKALRGRLHGYAIGAVALVAVLIALAASNTAQVNVNWLIGSSRVSLVWLVLAAAILGWALGLIASARFHWRTRAPRR
jgi:uncharacterized integral membrane protein